MKIRMFSYGGSGYKFVSKMLHSKYIEARWDDGIHPYIAHSKPRKEFSQYDKIIFIYGDPRNAMLSHIRRSDGYRVTKNNDYMFGTRRFRQLSEPFEVETKIQEDKILLSNFITKYPDYLDFNGFFKSWLEYPFPKDYILFLRYEDITDNVSNLADFLKLGRRFKKQISEEFKVRKSDFSKHSKEVVEVLNNNHSELIKMQNSLDSFYIK